VIYRLPRHGDTTLAKSVRFFRHAIRWDFRLGALRGNSGDFHDIPAKGNPSQISPGSDSPSLILSAGVSLALIAD